ncbi:2TM domain-containing protein [Sungkyunkwania multivorans]|uniref:2TM domain-containing protein n=1 Tax=Sungkyunkwania multivorans TaxID=1173618 RepID=A0ABW3CST1_9FLAO
MTWKRFIKELLKAFSVGVAVFLVLGVINYYNGRRYVLDESFFTMFAYHQLFSVVLYMVNMFLIVYLLRRYKKELFTIKFLFTGIAGSVVVSMIAIFFLRMFNEVGLKGESWQEFISGERISYYWVSLTISIVVTAIFYSVFYYKYRQEHKVKEQKIIAGAASAQFDALKNQLDPHFLFNSLNVLTSLIEEDPYQAQKFTTSLSKVYRYVLEQKNKELVTVDEELKFAKTYVSLLKMRFEDSIVFEIPDKASDPEAKVVPLSLQLLLENAVKHNMVTPAKPLHVTITEEQGNLVVTNNLQPKQVVKKSSGVGLRNIHQRYAILTNRAVSIDKTTSEFIVKIPMLTKQVTTMKTQDTFIKDKRYQRAKERVDAIKGFYGNLISYCIVIPLLAWLNFRTTDFPWVIFPALGWGFGVLAHGLEAFGYHPLWGKRWEQKKIREYMEKDNF